jgi:acyl-[acyl-carrier-protein]-phospholipid O-acyltransferase/long-chain-fatty-acid--[acyl-carrier-protein] ligase
MKALLHLILKLWFRFRAFDTSVLSAPGPVLLIPNHVSWLDWAFLAALLDDDWKFVTSSTTAQTTWVHRKIMVNHRTFPVDPSSPYAAKRMAEFLQGGGRLVLFAEGRITLTGSMMKLFDGTGFLLHKTRARVILCYLRGAVRVPFVRHKGWTQWFPTVTAHFSPLLDSPKLEGVSNTVARRRLTAWLRDRMLEQQYRVEMEFGPTHVLAAIADTASKLPGKPVLEDINFQPLNYRRLMTGVAVLEARWRALLAKTPEGGRVGVLLPNVNAVPVTLLSLLAAGRVPAILNFSTGVPVMKICLDLAGVRQVITSRAFLEKAKLDLVPLAAAGIELLFLEEVRAGVTGGLKLSRLLSNIVSCGGAFRGLSARPDQAAVILFTSGSEGIPKGVELTHRNLLANVRQITAHLDVTDEERFFNAMPLFHSFGLTTCTLFPLVQGFYVFLYPSPLHYRVIPAVVYDKACTVVVGTNTFLNGYARKAHPYDFNSVKFLVAGAEKLQEATANTWARQFGVRILEGYGATECSPVLCANSRIEPRFGSVGRFLPGIEYRLEPVEGIDVGGRLQVRGDNIMRGYLNADSNAKFQALGGWYDTGDLARVDEDGFVFLMGRLKRFAKVSGEMVSLTAVEDAFAGAFPQFGNRCEIAVVAVPCEDKGEKLVAVTTEPRITLNDLREVIRQKGLTNLSVPREIRTVREIPKLGTGKTNHRELMALLADPQSS